jgi:hypothetical protein
MPAFTCPDANMPVYVTSTGGNPGITSSTTINNTYAAVGAYIGPCSTAAAKRGLVVDEATTVGLVFATAQFSGAAQAAGVASGSAGATTIGSVSGTTAANGGNIGAPIGTISGGTLTVTNQLAYTNIQNAFATANNLVNVSTGLAGPVSASGIANDSIGPYSTTNKINTIADILAYCVQTDGLSTDTPPACTNLASSTTGVTPKIGSTALTAPTDTFQMAQYMALSPTTNIATVYGYASAKPFFTPTSTSAPFDWTLAIGYTGPQTAVAGATNGFGLLAPAVDAKGQVWMSATLLGGLFAVGPTGSALNSGSAYNDSGAYSGATETTIDASGNVWTANGGSASSSVLEYNPTAATYAKYAGSTSPTCGPSALALDTNYNFVYTCVKETSSPAYPINALLNTGSTTMPAYTATSQVGNTGTGATAQIFQIESDPSGNIWVPLTSTDSAVIEMTPSPTVSAPTTYTAGTVYKSATTNSGGGLVIDHTGQVWFDATQSTLSKLNGTTVTNYATAGTSGGGQSNSAFMAIDGAGDIWMANASGMVLGTGSSAVKYFTVSEYNNSASPITPPSTSTAPGGYAHNIGQPKYVAIDGSGNVWVPNYQASGLITSYQITSSTSITITGSTTGIPAALFPSSSSYVTLYGFGTSTFLNGLTFTTPSSATTAGSIVLTLVSNATLTAGSVVTENGFVNIGSGIAPAVTEIVGAAVPVYTPLGTAAALNKQAVLP